MDIKISDMIAVVSSIIAAGSLLCSYFSYKTSQENNNRNLELNKIISAQNATIEKEIYEKGRDLSIQLFKRQGVIELHMAWRDVNEINLKNLIGPDVKKAVNALSLTSSIWNHDIIAKEILVDHYWDTFRDLYDILYSSSEIVPGYTKTCKQFISLEMTKAYEDMKKMTMKKTNQTTL